MSQKLAKSDKKVQDVIIPESTEVQTKSDLINVLKNEFSSTVTSVYINSLDKEVSFREITVLEQKTLTRVMGTNEHRKDIIYDAQCALINTAALDPTFDIYKCSDFDRLKVLMSIYQTNMFADEVEFECSECGAKNKYKVDFNNALLKLDEIILDVKQFEYENRHFKYKFNIEFPSVSYVSSFHKSYFQKHRGTPRNKISQNDTTQNIEYINLFIKSIDITNKATNKSTIVDFSKYVVGDREEILATFPQDVLYSQHGVLMFITDNFIKPMNSSFDKHECCVCGAIHEKGDINSSESFF